MIKFFVDGDPRAQPRARVYRTKTNKSIAVSAPKDHPIWSWREAVTIEGKQHRPDTPMDGPIALALEFGLRRPKSHYGTGKNAHSLKKNAPDWHTNIPDLDNLEKTIMDVLTQLSYWHDDRQVCIKNTSKKWARIPGVRTSINQIVNK